MENDIIEVFVTANWILGIIAVYLVVIIGMGLYFSRRIQESIDLTIAGRKLSYIYTVASTLAMWICAGAMMGAAGYAYLFGMQGVIFDPWAAALTMVLVGLFFAHRLRQARYVTVTEFFNSRYNKLMGFLYSIIQILAGIAWQGGQVMALGIVVSLTTGFPRDLTVIIAASVIIIITVLGGLWALSRVDALNIALIIVGLLMLLPVAIDKAGGLSHFVATAENWAGLPTWAMVPVDPEIGGYLGYTGILAIFYYIAAWAALGLGDTNSQGLLQRALATKDEKTTVTSFLSSGVLYLLLGLVPVIVGISVFTIGVEVSPDKADHVLAWAAYNFLPPWLGVIFIVALFAAIISTAGNLSLTIATLFTHNVYQELRPVASDREMLTVVRIAIAVGTILAMIIAIYFEALYKLIIFSGAIGLATVFASYVFGLFWKKANTIGAISSYVAGIVSWVISFLLVFPTTIEANTGILAEGEVYWEWAIADAVFISLTPATIISIVTLIVVSLVTQKIAPPKPMLSRNGENMEKVPKFFWSK